jgi:S1-C subfamily serine protease
MSTTLSSSSLSLLASVSDELAGAVERAGAAVVTVDARRRHPASGIVWSGDGLIATANHVVERDEEIGIGLPDGRSLAAELVGRDPGSDLALLRVAASDLTPLSRSDVEPRAGHLALAIARPGPSGVMASLGVVSAVGGPLRFRGGATLDRYVQADVAMLPGFSGGPLVDSVGNLIGLNSSVLGRAGQLTVLTATIDATLATLLQHGRVRRGYLGVGAQGVRLPETLARALDNGQELGLLIVSVEAGGPADAAGLMLGDVILAVDGAAVGQVEQLQEQLAGDRVGKSIPIRIARGGEPREIAVTIGERQRQAE